MSTRTKIENGRAEFAYEKVEKLWDNGNNKDVFEKYTSYVKNLPSMILLNGLGPTIGFIWAKKKSKGEKENSENKAYKAVYYHIEEYLKSDNVIRPINRGKLEKEGLLKYLTMIDSQEYRYITEEVLAFTSWLKRIATGMSK